MECSESPRDGRFAWIGAGAFLLLGLVRIWFHEPWRDECGVWLSGHNCATLSELFHYLKYDGHPYFWAVLAWGIAQWSTQFFALQVVHVMLASTAIFFLLRYAPWPRWEVILCALGYFTFYEYSIICRAYVLALLGAVLVASAWQNRGGRPLLGGIGILLLTQSSVFGVIITLALIPTLLWNAWRRYREGLLSREWCLGWGVPLVLGIAFSMATMFPPPDADTALPWVFRLDASRLKYVSSICWWALFPLPDISTKFPWNTNIADGFGTTTTAVLGVLALLGMLWALRRDPGLCAFLFMATSAIILFSYLKYPGSIRHHGHVFIVLLMSLWMLSLHPANGQGTQVFFRRIVLVVQMTAGIWLSTLDWLRPFTANRQAAEWIAERGFEDHLLVGSGAHPVSGISMYLGRQIYYLNRERFGTFIIRNNHRREFPKPAELFQVAADLGDKASRPVLLILNQEQPAQLGFHREASFTDSLIADERFYVYTREVLLAQPPREESQPR